MFDYPLTIQEARAYCYRQWAGSPKGTAYNPARCVASVPDGGRSPLSHRCSRQPGKGPDGLYCGPHAKKVEKQVQSKAQGGPSANP